MQLRLGKRSSLLLGFFLQVHCFAGDAIFRVATYNLENYLVAHTGTRPAKSAQQRSNIVASILAVKPDVLAVQGMGTTNDLEELRAALRAQQSEFPFWEYVDGYDTNIHLAVLSKFPITARNSHTNDVFLLGGRKFRVGRGFGEVAIRVNDQYSFTLITAHLKSRRPVPEADETELREHEALLLRKIVEAKLKENAKTNLIVLGDFNDTPVSGAVKCVIGKGKTALFDTRPAERIRSPSSDSGNDERKVVWTHYYEKEDSYSRLDYILVSQGMKREWVSEETGIGVLPNWGMASDHRPIVAAFYATEK